MKTIEEESITYLKKDLDIIDGEYTYESIVNAFEAGVEFAQKWYYVNDELPDELETVLVRDKNGCIALATVYVSKNMGKYFSVEANVIQDVNSWRPIELK